MLIDLDIEQHMFELNYLHKELEIMDIESHIIGYLDFSMIHKSSDSMDKLIRMFWYFCRPKVVKDTVEHKFWQPN